ncbi:(d)CMP kinase [Mycoplasmopsis pulmonis]|uniref:Cytidylate kinase n=1 Tax=Mycoplasmopsis pulmonis (strain UAB CTIP) TaxID=272635 RepID=KCY_MYCPU|nr:(d)CMP kinase [Mycoplasmopsis pulmonis]Q98RC0.2 RecName: Full=Cytidylate kinase; Short=CK; AltName: Full=Cytidine monophosphate kinase; Short=CMP kinase [Mycoplasmopsis pulmonis UAB CTIP]MDZ7293062.1 (d)CMP kinase [Mycoplasmopsis pulmonis]VEU67855.1 cytidylate kinase [Mycoplasmopsis pulmonis]
MTKNINIAIDGPSGVGKSTIAKKLADHLNYVFINTGLFYRAIAFYKDKFNLTQDLLVKELKNIKINYVNEDQIFLNNQDIAPYLRDEKISEQASEISTILDIRNFINQIIIDTMKVKKGYVIEGRDTTFKLAPDAEVRIFLDASSPIRARRRVLQNSQLNTESNYEKILDNINKRDYSDRNREVDPLHVAQGVIAIVNDHMNIEETFEKILGLVNEAIDKK